MPPSIRWIPLALVLGCTPAAAPTPTQPRPAPAPPLTHIDEAQAEAYFAEAAQLFARDGGQLWGVRLDGPILILDPETRQVAANQKDAQGKLAARDHIFTGHVGDEVSPANSALDWAGVRWTEVMWPLPEDAPARKRLLAHEAFHRQQPALHLPMEGNDGNAHLDALEGRILLQLEWRALKKAVLEQGARRQEAIEDALVFRARRREIFPLAAQEERALEMNEGLAEYTGNTLASDSPAERRVVATQLLDNGTAKPSFVRSFAYASGPAYGLLLDEAGARWRRSLAPGSDLGALLAQATGARLPPKLEAGHRVPPAARDRRMGRIDRVDGCPSLRRLDDRHGIRPRRSSRPPFARRRLDTAARSRMDTRAGRAQRRFHPRRPALTYLQASSSPVFHWQPLAQT
ncbi:hypothetical protein LVJ94_08570 [Pendulispora rubella]|uniref:Uncharacterized protein n=1 Tax=Pendulispora rubella TaxID=2741070 RepID=A0ABZ2LCJ9_9BACT